MGHRVTMVTGLIGSQGHWVIGSITRVFFMVRVSMVTMVLGHGSPWVTITRIIGSQGYRVTGHHGHRVTITMVLGLMAIRSRVTGHRVTITRAIGSPESQGHRVMVCPGLRSQGHQNLGSRVTRVTGLPLTHHHGLGLRVIGSPITQVSGYGSPWVTITMVLGHGSPITREIESPITRVTGLPWSQGYYHH